MDFMMDSQGASRELQSEIAKLKGPIVVMGAGGFIGANLIRAILSCRPDCFGVTHQTYIPWRLADLDPSKILHGDLNRRSDIEKLFVQYSFKTIFFFAAYGAYSRQTDVDLIYQTNLSGLWHVIDTASKKGFSALVHAGTSSEYGWNCQSPSEDALLAPNSHYAVSKAASGHLIQFLAKARRLPVINLRIYSVYGPWEESDRLIPTIVQQGLKGKYPPLVDPDISRDFVYVDDVIEAAVLAATRGVESAAGRSVNIGTGKPTTIRELADLTRELFHLQESPVWSSMPNRSWDLKNWYGNPAQAQKLIGWQPRTSLKEGLEKTLQWFKERPGLPEIHAARTLLKPVRLSAVIACYKDNQAIPLMYDRLTKVFQALRVDYEIIFVNDASPDDSDEVLARICGSDEHVVAVEHSRNFGSQSAFLSGMGVSTGDAVILLDGDLQDPPEVIPAFYEKWKEGFEVVYGRRAHRQASFLTNLCYKAFYRVLRTLAYVPIPLDAGDFSMLDRRVVSELLALPETDQFLRGLRAWLGFRQTSVDYDRPERAFGVSTNNLKKNIWWARKGLFSFTFAPLDFLLYGGLAMTCISFVALFIQIALRFMNVKVPQGLTTVIVLILFFGGIQLLGLSILGEYLGKVLEESKRRPKFIRKAVRLGSRRLVQTEELAVFLNSRAAALPDRRIR